MTPLHSLLITTLCVVSLLAPTPTFANQPTPSLNSQTSVTLYRDADLDRLLAPVALYPDTLLTHILIATTYPLDVVAASRWRQSNLHLSAAQIEHALQNETWDPSVKALIPLTGVLARMADDLNWLGTLGEAVIADQSRVLDRVQYLRRYAHTQGALQSNNYLAVSRNHQVIAIVPRQHTRLYVPFYDTRIVFGHWHHRIQPVYWRYPSHARRYAGVHWSIGFNLSSGFYFGGIHWHDRYVAISRTPIRHWRPAGKRVHSSAFQRWQHRQHRYTGAGKRAISRERQLASPRVASRVVSDDKAYRDTNANSRRIMSLDTVPERRVASVVKTPRQSLPIQPTQKLHQATATTNNKHRGTKHTSRTLTPAKKRLHTPPARVSQQNRIAKPKVVKRSPQRHH